MENTNDFLPQGYEAPKGNENYMKLEKGENKFRILSKPILGWIDWKDNKPLRFRMSDKPSQPVDPKKPIKHFWAMVVYSYKSDKVQILELTQRSIQARIETLAKDEEWGSPLGYDLKITRKGDGMETEYDVTPSVPKPLPDAISGLYSKMIIDIDALYTGGDPFAMMFDKAPF
jgi:hypothetical protein